MQNSGSATTHKKAIAWLPLKLENLEEWESIFQSGKSYPKYWKMRKKLFWKIEKNTGKGREICQPVTVKTLQIWDSNLNKNIFKTTGKLRKILEKSGKGRGKLSV